MRFIPRIQRRKARQKATGGSRAMLRLEPLEDRTVPTMVTSAADDLSAGTLREVIAGASQDDTIVFDPRLDGQTITLHDSLVIMTNLTITGPGADLLTISSIAVEDDTFFVSPRPFGVTLNMSGLTIGQGGGIENHGALTITDCAIRDNGVFPSGAVSNLDGGAIYNAGILTLRNCSLSGNRASDEGGAIYNDGTLTLANCTFNGNRAEDSGGGIENQGALTMTGCTFNDNHTRSGGGGIRNDGTLTLANCTLSGNTTGEEDGGGVLNNGTMIVANTIIAGNGVYPSNGVGPDFFGTVHSLGNNLIGDSTGSSGFDAGGDQAGTAMHPIDPLLGPLQDNGGPTFTMALLPGSPAIDAGNNARAVDGDGNPLATDERGFARISGAAVDIGAFEVQQLVVTTTADSGSGSLREALTAAAAAGGSIISFAPGLGDTIDLQSALPDIPRSTEFLAPSASLTVERSPAAGTPPFRIFTIDGPAHGIVEVRVSIAALTIANGLLSPFDGGGAIENGGILTLANCTLSGNHADESGGGIENVGTLTLSNCTLSRNSADIGNGGGIDNRGTLSLANCTLSNNSGASGAGINNTGTLTLAKCTLSSNQAFVSGGGIENGGMLTVTDCTFSGNSGSLGGGIDNDGSLTLAACTFNGNSANQFSGGGINNQGTLTVTNSTFYRNRATFSAGGIGNDTGATATLTNCTLSGNTATIFDVGGVLNSGTLTVANTIIAGNVSLGGSDPDVSGTFHSLGNNLIGDSTSSSGFDASGDEAGTAMHPIDPLLGSLQDNGGPTFTMALLPGSPAIDAGSTALAVGPDGQPLTTDQRGFARISGSAVDIGAFEVQHYVVTTTADSGPGSLRDALTSADLASGSDITFAPGVAGIIDLQSALPDLSRSTRVLGPGADVVTVRRSAGLFTPAFRIFTVDGPAGGIVDVTVTLSGLAIVNGRASDFVQTGSGGGIWSAGTLTVANCAIAGNFASAGGGIYNEGALTLTGCTLDSNQAQSGFGGAIDNAIFGRLALFNCTLDANSAFYGGGIEDELFARLTLTNCTLAGNTAAVAGGGLYVAGRAPTIANTIVATNTAPTAPDVSGAVTSRGYNLLGNPSGNSGFTASDQMGTATSPLDPLLTSLGNYGGPTLTMAPRLGSPARAAGNIALAVGADGQPLATDQRGFARVVDGAVDIGAFEVQDIVINLNPGENVRLQRDATLPALLDVVFSNSTRPNFTIDTATLSRIIINGSLDNEVDLEDVPAGIAVSFNGKGGVQTVDLTPTAQNLDHIQGPVTVTGVSAPVTISLNDQAGPASDRSTLTASTFSRLNFGGLTYSGVGTLTINMAPGNPLPAYQSTQNIYVLGTPANMTTTISAANGWHDIFVGLPNSNLMGLPGTPLDGIQGPVTVRGAAFQDVLNIDDSASTAARTYSLGATSISAGGTIASVGWQGLVGVVTLLGSTAADTYQVQSLPSGLAALNVFGQPLHNTIQSTLAGDHTWLLYPNESAVLDYGLQPVNIVFLGVYNLIGGPGADRFVFLPSNGMEGKIDGTLDGGGGTNTLDYSHTTGDVMVDLTINMASRVHDGAAGKLLHIANVTGSIGNDLLVGDANPNVLVGGTGRNVLIGGAGGDTLDASRSMGDNLIIGGRTDYDTSLAALNAIFAEWNRTDLGFRDRFSDLGSGSNGSGATPLNVVNGQLILLTAGQNPNNPGTVHPDTSPDTLIASNLIDPVTGKRVHNWLFYDSDDTIMNFDPSSDHKTQVR
jgi:hypothetical protein